MHFSIPDTQEFIDEAHNTYLGYNIHINGLFHCTVRYKQLHNLHEQLTKELDVSLPPFPPKRLFPLTINQQEERRLSLEKYIQTIGQNSVINGSELLNGFLLNAHRETVGDSSEDEDLDVFLINGYKITLSTSTREHSGQILKKVCRHIKLPDQYIFYFSLFILSQEEDNSVNVLRKLQDFESPIITLKNIRTLGIRIVLAKDYWDIEYDLELMQNPVALNLLYIQAAAEIDRGWILVTDELRDRLSRLRNSGEKAEYLSLARSLKYYGYIQFAPCFCDYPHPGSRVLVAIGRNELNLRISLEDEEDEGLFKVTRMRCWRISTLHNDTDKSDDNDECNLELSFEYLMARNQLQWITISSEQAILMSVCLQAMIDELLLKNVGGNKSQQEVSGKSWIYIMRDGHSRVIIGSTSNDSITTTQKDDENGSSAKSEPIMRKLTERLSAVTTKKSNDVKTTFVKLDRRNTSCDTSMENNAFHMIGDDDL